VHETIQHAIWAITVLLLAGMIGVSIPGSKLPEILAALVPKRR
jgi:hypothetical protein